MDRKQVVLDMDPGIDDALAMVVALNRFTVIGVSTVAGNAPVEQTFQNAHRILQFTRHSTIPVVAGADRPLFYPLLTAEDIHGFSGMGAYTWDVPDVPHSGELAWNWMARRLTTSSVRCHLVATGPLTNIAMLLWAHPESHEHIGSISCMGGALPGSKMDKAFEFNVYVDPHAADVVFRYGPNVRLIGINVAHRALMPVSQLDRFKQFGRVGQMLFDLLQFYAVHARGEGGDPQAMPLDDALVVAATEAPELFQWEEMPLTVVREGPLRGTVVLAPYAAEREPVQVATSVDAPQFFEWLWASLTE
ncbi:MAG: nucleoside hydrolase [Sulfobacillus sp.]